MYILLEVENISHKIVFLNLPNKPKLSNVKYLNTKAEKQLNKIEIKTFSANVFSIWHFMKEIWHKSTVEDQHSAQSAAQQVLWMKYSKI